MSRLSLGKLHNGCEEQKENTNKGCHRRYCGYRNWCNGCIESGSSILELHISLPHRGPQISTNFAMFNNTTPQDRKDSSFNDSSTSSRSSQDATAGETSSSEVSEVLGFASNDACNQGEDRVVSSPRRSSKRWHYLQTPRLQAGISQSDMPLLPQLPSPYMDLQRNAIPGFPSQSQKPTISRSITPPLRHQVEKPVCPQEIIKKRFFIDEWSHPSKRRKILVRALGSSGTQATLHSAFPYLPEIAYLSIICRLLASLKLIQRLTSYLIAYLKKVQGTCLIAAHASPEAKRENLAWCQLRTQQLLNTTRWWISSVCIFEYDRLQWAEDARRLRDPTVNPHYDTVRERLVNYGLLADVILPADLSEIEIGTQEEANNHPLVRSLDWLYNGFRILFCEDRLAPGSGVERLRVLLGSFLRDYPERHMRYL
jgi:hypothetical protein